ncbi:hypothetical protein HBI38_042970 [Parastagonospora nodorum]|nr:hypothetical protein HBI73_128200 [Parastagonospora nodorum]KAH6277634.1 hypothetical protein HBI41_053210 [Parastagonospora nodorum]KAH6298238.1 hypothetical protein HBI40_049620 [Parastagonospora nodorum]KAH6327668.1 hypothetical protein HBI38_042970 [Parastagonospora nodorum]KAH6419365.1 hypothetical protein HBI14_087950 [Parastagonospora nodorum]
MQISFLPLLFLIHGVILPCLAQDGGISQPPGLENVKDAAQQKRLLRYWSEYGCYAYGDKSEPNVKDQCREACFPGGITSDVPAGKFVTSSQTCWYNGPESDLRSGKPLTEDQKKESPRPCKEHPTDQIMHQLTMTLVPTIKTGYCICDDPIVNILGDFFLESAIETGKVLQKVMCPALLALDLVVELGSAAIPGVGKAITLGMSMPPKKLHSPLLTMVGTGIKTAKMFKHAYDAQDAAMEWASMFVEQGFGLASAAGCKTPFSFSKPDLAKRFLDFADAPDELVPGLNYDDLPCPKGKKASKKCKEKIGDHNDSGSSSKTEDNKQSTKTPEQTTLTTHSPTYSRISGQTSSSAPSATPTVKVDCAAIGRMDMEAFWDEFPEMKEHTVEKRVIGTTLYSRRLEVRTPKSGVVCEGTAKTILASKEYPRAGDPFMNNAVAYGFNDLDSCDDYRWGKQTNRDKGLYDTEHVLEWSIITGFFNSLNDHPDFKDGFLHPDPESKERGQKVSWHPGTGLKKTLSCRIPILQLVLPLKEWTFWNKSRLSGLQKHIPMSMARRKMLQGHTRMSSSYYKAKSTNKSRIGMKMFSSHAIFDAKKVQTLIQRTNTDKFTRRGPKFRQRVYPDPFEQPRVVIHRLRSAVGTLLYMQEPEINKIFIAQVDRIGAQLENLENALQKNPRKVNKKNSRTNDVSQDHVVTFDPWQPQKLKEKWFKYMDEAYKNANSGVQEFVDDTVAKLRVEFDDARLIKQADIDKEKDKTKKEELAKEKKLRVDMKKYTPKFEEQWIRANGWSKPKWNE